MDYIKFKKKAKQNLSVAEWCFENRHYDAACNRAYYAMYHAAIAALANEGIKPQDSKIKHSWVQSHFALYFCKRDKIFPKFNGYLPKAQKRRDKADYRPELVSIKQAKRQLIWAREFVNSLLRRI